MTYKIVVTNLGKLIASVTATRTITEVVNEVEVVRTWSKTLEKRRFEQDGKTLPQIRAEIEAEMLAAFQASLVTDAFRAQITNQEALLASETLALEAE